MDQELVSNEQQIYHLRRAGVSVDEIADKVGVSTAVVVRTYREYVTKMMSEHSLTDRDMIIAVEEDRLDSVFTPFFVAAQSGDMDGLKGMLAIMTHRMKLQRLDMPSPDELARNITVLVGGTAEDFAEALRTGQAKTVTSHVIENEKDKEAL